MNNFFNTNSFFLTQLKQHYKHLLFISIVLVPPLFAIQTVTAQKNNFGTQLQQACTALEEKIRAGSSTLQCDHPVILNILSQATQAQSIEAQSTPGQLVTETLNTPKASTKLNKLMHKVLKRSAKKLELAIKNGAHLQLNPAIIEVLNTTYNHDLENDLEQDFLMTRSHNAGAIFSKIIAVLHGIGGVTIPILLFGGCLNIFNDSLLFGAGIPTIIATILQGVIIFSALTVK